MFRRAAVVMALTLAVAATASAQSGTSGTSTAQNPSGTQTPSGSTATSDVRPATTTFFGDTGLWFVPTAEVLAHGKWSASGYRRGTNYIQGLTNIGDFAGTFGVGVGDRAEIFASFLVDDAGRDPAGHDDLLWRHGIVVCPDRRGARSR